MPAKTSEVGFILNDSRTICSKTASPVPPNKLVIRLQPDEGVDLVMNKVGLTSSGSMDLQKTQLNLSFQKLFGRKIADACEKLLLEVMLGNQALFVRR